MDGLTEDAVPGAEDAGATTVVEQIKTKKQGIVLNISKLEEITEVNVSPADFKAVMGIDVSDYKELLENIERMAGTFVLGQLPPTLKGLARVPLEGLSPEQQVLVDHMDDLGFTSDTDGEEAFVIAEVYNPVFRKTTKLGLALFQKGLTTDDAAGWGNVNKPAIVLIYLKVILGDQLSSEKLASGGYLAEAIGSLQSGRLPGKYHPAIATITHLVGDVIPKEAFGFAKYLLVATQCMHAASGDDLERAWDLFQSAPNAMTSFIRSTTKDKSTTVEKQATIVLQYPKYFTEEEQELLVRLSTSGPGYPEIPTSRVGTILRGSVERHAVLFWLRARVARIKDAAKFASERPTDEQEMIRRYPELSRRQRLM